MYWDINRTIDLKSDGIGVERLHVLATRTSRSAHRILLKLVSGGQTPDLTGAKVLTNLILPDGSWTDEKQDIQNDLPTVILPDACYDRQGDVKGTVHIEFANGSVVPVYAFILTVSDDTTDIYVDRYKVIPSLQELLAQIQAAKDAANAANAAAQAVSDAAASASAAAKEANTAAGSAQSAANRADTAADAIEGMTATAMTLATGQAATASVTMVGGHYQIALGLPRGLTGATPQLTLSVQTGEPGTDATAVLQDDSTAEAPHYLLTIPRGRTGNIGELKINGVAPGADGSVTLTAENIGARPDTWMPSAQDVGARPDDWIPTAADVGAETIDLLWKQDTVSSFAAHKINLDLSAFDAVRIEIAATTSQTSIRVTHEVRVGMSCILSFVSGYRNKIHTRMANVSVDGINFGAANVSSSTSVETSCIPTRIWGVKWGAIDDFSA